VRLPILCIVYTAPARKPQTKLNIIDRMRVCFLNL
jgi:hypothetical protein